MSHRSFSWSGLFVLIAFLAGAVFLSFRAYEKLATPKDPLLEQALAIEEASDGRVDVLNIEYTEKTVAIYILPVGEFGGPESPEWLRYKTQLVASYSELRGERMRGIYFLVGFVEGQYYIATIFVFDLPCLEGSGLANECFLMAEPAMVVLPADKLRWLNE